MIKNILIVEDEALIADHLELLLQDLDYSVTGIADDSDSMLEILTNHEVDLVLLDIQLSGHLDGIDLAHIIRDKYKIPFIFVTSNSDQRTIARAKLTGSSGFITKPFSKAQLSSSIALVAKTDFVSTENGNEDAFFIKENHEFIRVNYQDVLYVEASDNYAIIYTQSGRFVLSQTLKTVESKLEGYGFFRVHRSYLVNLKKITKVAPKSLFIGEIEIPISESNRPELLEKLNLF